jgi:hypothetical protein
LGTNARNTLIMISAADETTRPVLARPWTTLPRSSPVRWCSSRTRDSRNTS